MGLPPTPENEEERLKALYQLKLLDTPREERFDRIVQMVCNVLDVPMASFTIIDKDRQWFKSNKGLGDDRESPLELSFCAHVVAGEDMMIVPDANKDNRFFENPLVTGAPYIVFYAGCPVHSPDGFKIGSLCAVDDKPRSLTLFQIEFLRDMAKLIEMEIVQ